MASVDRAVLLAAGRGTRLGTLTVNRPKPMVPLCGKPILERIIVGLRNAGLREFLIVIGYRGDAIREYFGDGSAWDLRIDYADQPVPNGTGAALACATEWSAARPEASVLASFGDIYTDPNHYPALIEDYESGPCAALVGINLLADPTAGAAVYREGDRILRVVEKPPPGTATGKWNMAGVSIYGPEVWEVLPTLRPSPRGEIEITDAISALIARSESGGRLVRAHEMRGFWSDIGTPEALQEAEQTCEAGDWA
jgi:NDP-sugar pyrophosphorylase family protein